MKTSSLRKFIQPRFLRAAGRERVARFLASFAAGEGAAPPSPDGALSEEEYFCAVAAWLLRPEPLPGMLAEALHAIEEMASAEGQERLERALAQAGMELTLPGKCTRLDIAIEAWVAAPELFAEQHRRQRMHRLARFEYFGGRGLDPDSSRPAPPHSLESIQRLEQSLDAWFARHQRGQHTALVECHPLDGEYWFLVRHGDTFARARAVERRRTEILQFRPERDDLVVYCPAHDDIRVSGRTQGERNLYREEFGVLLWGNREHFCDDRTYTLEPLRAEGADSLDARGVDGIKRVTLRELKVVEENGRGEFILRGSQDLFAAQHVSPNRPVVPSWGRLARAAFDFEFAGSSRVRTVEVQPPNVVKLARHCDARLIGRFFCSRGFRRHRCRQSPCGCQEDAGS